MLLYFHISTASILARVNNCKVMRPAYVPYIRVLINSCKFENSGDRLQANLSDRCYPGTHACRAADDLRFFFVVSQCVYY